MIESTLSIVNHTKTMTYMDELGALIKQARDAHGLTGLQLARDIGKVPSFVSRLETGAMKDLPSPEDLHALSRVLGIPVSDMVRAAGYDIGDAGKRVPNPASALEPLIRAIDWSDKLAVDNLQSQFVFWINNQRERREQ